MFLAFSTNFSSLSPCFFFSFSRALNCLIFIHFALCYSPFLSSFLFSFIVNLAQKLDVSGQKLSGHSRLKGGITALQSVLQWAFPHLVRKTAGGLDQCEKYFHNVSLLVITLENKKKENTYILVIQLGSRSLKCYNENWIGARFLWWDEVYKTTIRHPYCNTVSPWFRKKFRQLQWPAFVIPNALGARIIPNLVWNVTRYLFQNISSSHFSTLTLPTSICWTTEKKADGGHKTELSVHTASNTVIHHQVSESPFTSFFNSAHIKFTNWFYIFHSVGNLPSKYLCFPNLLSLKSKG